MPSSSNLPNPAELARSFSQRQLGRHSSSGQSGEGGIRQPALPVSSQLPKSLQHFMHSQNQGQPHSLVCAKRKKNYLPKEWFLFVQSFLLKILRHKYPYLILISF
jgi:hypothetical protein